VTNNGAVDHNLTIDAMGFSQNFAPGETVDSGAFGLEPGVYNFVCNIHPGMAGNLTITG
jgi:plastocyanin